MPQKVNVNKIDAAVAKALKKYGEEIGENLDEITKSVARGGARELQAASSATFNGTKYAKGWSVQLTQNRIGGARAIIYNKTPGLPHLLENGHAKRGGGRVAGRAHIKPVEEKLIEAYKKEVLAKL